MTKKKDKAADTSAIDKETLVKLSRLMRAAKREVGLVGAVDLLRASIREVQAETRKKAH